MPDPDHRQMMSAGADGCGRRQPFVDRRHAASALTTGRVRGCLWLTEE